MGNSSEKASAIDGQFSLFDYYYELFNEAEILKYDSTEPDIDEITVSARPSRIFNHTLSEEELFEKFPEGYCEPPVEVYNRLFYHSGDIHS